MFPAHRNLLANSPPLYILRDSAAYNEIAVIISISFLFLGALAWAQTPASTQTDPQAFLTKYCVTCHNTRLKTAGLTLDASEFAHPTANAETWEKVIRKLRNQSMPPAGALRPDAPAYDAAATFLETALDRAGAAKPEPGKMPLLHRLTRTQYQNAIRDLLGLDALPKEMDYTMLLPPDNASSGFDNLADLLFISPTTMERYLGAARKISRLAVGDPEIPEMVNIYPLPGDQPRDARVDGLPFGTRGGMLTHTDLPRDGEYLFKIEFAGPARESHQVEIIVDGQRVIPELDRVGSGWLPPFAGNAGAERSWLWRRRR